MERLKKVQNKKQPNKLLKNIRISKKLEKELGLNISKEDKYVIPIFIPHRGCNNECVFCNQKQISGEQRNVTPQDVKNEIETWLKSLKNKDKSKQVAFFGGSFTGLDIKEQEEFLKAANEYISKGEIDSVKLSTRPDYIDENILKLLKKYNVKCIELGVQSMDEEVLLASKRGHTSQDVIVASKLIKKYGFELGHQVMVGLPKSSLEKEIETINKCIKLKPDVVRIYPVYVLKKSKLYDMSLNGEYIPLNLDDAVERAKEVYKACIKKNIRVIRIGLQTTEEINEKNEEILGPVCDNYKERILTNISRDYVLGKIKNKRKFKKIMLVVPKNTQNYVIGNSKSNITYFEEKLGLKLAVKGK